MLNTGSLTVIGRLGAMFERTASVRTEEDLQNVLWQVAHTIGETLGYRAVVVNIYRPAFDDMFTAAAVGSDDSVELLLGQTSLARDLDAAVRPPLRAAWRLLRPAGRLRLGPDSRPRPTRRRSSPRDDPDAWQADDALFVPLRGTTGKLLGVVSVDEPESGRRPSDADIDALVASSSHAALAIRIAQDVATAAQHQRMLEHVLEVSARLAQAGDVPALLQAVCDGIRDALAFEKVVIELADEPRGTLVPVAAAGWMVDAPAVNPGMSLDSFAPLFTPEFEMAGCYLVPHDVAEIRLGPKRVEYQSELNGRGPHAWNTALAARAAVGAGRSPDRPDLGGRPARPAAALAHAPAGAAAVRQPGHVGAPLGRPGRAAALRGHARSAHLAAQPARAPGAPAAGGRGEPSARRAPSRSMLCDMDNLKMLNDTLGHEAGDVALKLLAGALRSGLRRADDAYRLGGDEFAVVLPGASRLDAERVTRRLREATAACAAEPVKAIDASFGIAVHEPARRPTS